MSLSRLWLIEGKASDAVIRGVRPLRPVTSRSTAPSVVFFQDFDRRLRISLVKSAARAAVLDVVDLEAAFAIKSGVTLRPCLQPRWICSTAP